MSERYWQRSVRSAPRAAVLLAAAGAVAITGCGSAASNGAAGSGSKVTTSAGMAAATLPAATGPGFSATQIRNALLAEVNGMKPAAPPETGEYGSLPDVQTGKRSMRSVTVKPAECAQATVTGFNSPAFATAPASVVTFRVGRDGVSEVLVSASQAAGAAAMAVKLPAECAHYHATLDGKTFAYAIKEIPLHGIAEQAHAVNVKTIGYDDADVWSVVFLGRGFMGAVTIVGPDSSERGAEVLAREAYARAADSLA